jgi:SNF2 family DNA or RNA helicase
MNYEFKTKPYDHQLTVFRESWDTREYALFMEMGTGKTKCTLDTAGALFESGKISAMLVIAPKGVYGNWVTKEIPSHLPDRIEKVVVQWQPSLTQKFRNELKQLTAKTEDRVLRVLAMNVEALSTGKGMDMATHFLKKHPDNIVVIDESTTIKTRTAQRTKNIVKLGKLAKYKRILTGSPITKNPMDLFSQCEFLGAENLGFNSFYTFQNRYAVIQRRTMGNRSFNHIVGYRRLDELNEKLNRFSVRVLKEDCLDLPEKIYMQRDVALTREQMEAYKQMSDYALAMLKGGKLSTTQSVLTQILRLQEICCGHLRVDDGQIRPLDNNRMTEMQNVISEMNGKVIIWASYVYDIRAIEDTLKKEHGDDSVVTFYGSTPSADRDDIVSQFQDPDSPVRFFVANPKTGGYGLTLTAATNMIYYNNSYDLEIRLQSEDRAHRIGQTKHVLYVDLVARGTVDERILQALRNKISIASQILGEDAGSWLL